MPLSPFFPRNGKRYSKAELKKALNYGPTYAFLERFASADMYYHKWDFQEDAINLDYWALANSGGTSAADFAISVARYGKIQGDTGTTDDGSISLVSPLIYYGDDNVGCRFRFKLDVVTDVHWECGFIDAVPGSNTGGVNDIDTPTAFATDIAVLAMDTDQTLKTPAFVTKGTAISAAKTNISQTTLPAADTYMDVVIQTATNSAACWVNGKLENAPVASMLEGGTALALWFYCRTRNTTAKFPDIDLIEVWGNRG